MKNKQLKERKFNHLKIKLKELIKVSQDEEALTNESLELEGQNLPFSKRRRKKIRRKFDDEE